MTAIYQRFGFRTFMLKHQYKVLAVSLAVGFIWVGIYRLFATSWFFSRLSLLLAIMSFVPAGLVLLVHMREAGAFMWWDNSNVVLTARRSRKLEKVELTVVGVLWAVIFAFLVFVIFVVNS
jgi:hypothetical protein